MTCTPLRSLVNKLKQITKTIKMTLLSRIMDTQYVGIHIY